MANSTEPSERDEPLILTIPGLDNNGPSHWQTLWESRYANSRRVDLGLWDRPHRNTWINKLNLAIHLADRPVVLVAHSLGCLVVAWWAQLEQSASDGKVLGALLVAPPEVDFFPADQRLEKFAPTPAGPLPFPTIVAASRNDPFMGIRTARQLARNWGSRFADAGPIGHINAESAIGEWPFGQFLLRQLIGPNRQARLAARKSGGAAGEAFRHAHGREASPALPG